MKSHMVWRLGFLVFTQAARVRLPVWEIVILGMALVTYPFHAVVRR